MVIVVGQQKCCWCWKMFNPSDFLDLATELVMGADDADKAVRLAGEIMVEIS